MKALRRKKISCMLLIGLMFIGLLSFKNTYAEGESSETELVSDSGAENEESTVVGLVFTSDINDLEDSGKLVVDMYKIADIEWDGKRATYVLKNAVAAFSDFKNDQDVGSKKDKDGKETNEFVTKENLDLLGSKALNIVKTNSSVSPVEGSPLEVNASEGFTKNGLYLAVTRSDKVTDKEKYIKTITTKDGEGKESQLNVSYASSNDKEYHFLPRLMFLMDTNGESPVKYESVPRYGELVIYKDLLTYAGKPVTFAFRVQGTKMVDEKEVLYDIDYASITFSKYGKKSYTVKHIPVGTKVTVTEVYQGGSYTVTTSESGSATILFPADKKENKDYKESSVTFINDFDDKKNNGFGANNAFKRVEKTNEDGEKTVVWQFIENDLPKPTADGGDVNAPAN